MNTIMRFPDFKSKCLTLNYDDGVVYDKMLIDKMSAHGLRGTFNINSGWFARTCAGRMSAEETAELYTRSGNEVAVHGTEHLPLAKLDTACATAEILNDRIALEKLFGTIIIGGAYAYGSCNKESAKILECCGISYFRTTMSTGNFDLPEDWLYWHPTSYHLDENLIELAKYFVNVDESDYFWFQGPRLFQVWGHSSELENGNKWWLFDQFANIVGNNDKIWYATCGEIYRYVESFNQLRYNADGNMVYNPTAQTLYLTHSGNNYTVAPGEMIKFQ